MPGKAGRSLQFAAVVVVAAVVLQRRAPSARRSPGTGLQPEQGRTGAAERIGATLLPDPLPVPVRRRSRRPRPLPSALVVAGAALVLVSTPSLAHEVALLNARVPAEAVLPVAAARVATELPGQVGPAAVHRRVARTPPTALMIPALGLDVRLVELGLRPDGHLQAPPLFDVPGWYSGGPQPGQPGAALIAGHVDSTRGPAVFYRLERLRPGDLIVVRQQDGALVKFRVDRLESFRKDRFPTDRVFGHVTTPELRLITCFGTFDRSKRSYTSNLVVSASLVTPPISSPGGRVIATVTQEERSS